MSYKIIIFLSLFWLPAVLTGQSPQIQSPYSIFGLGDFRSAEALSARSLGGWSAIYHDAANLNPSNPASFAFLKATTLDIGVSAQHYKLSSARGGHDDNRSGSFDNINLGLSLVNDYNRELEGRKSDWRFGMGLGIAPYSKVGYDIRTKATAAGEDLTYIFKGSGGAFQVNWGGGAKYKDFAFGINLGFLRGSVKETQENIFTDTVVHIYHNRFDKNYSYRGLNTKIGFIWDYHFKDAKKENGRRGDLLTIGGFFQPGFKLRTSFTERVDRIGASVPKIDSILYRSDVSFTSVHPALMGIGIGYGFEGLYRLGINYEGGNWTNFEPHFRKGRMGQASRWSVGYEKLADLKAFDSYFKKMSLRGGLFYGKDPRYVNDAQIRYYGLTIGSGLPVILPRQDIAIVNLGLEVGKTGIPTDLSTTYVKFSMSFTLTDKSWFFKQKYY